MSESPVYKQYRIYASELSTGLWLASIVNTGEQKVTTKDSLTLAVTRIPGEYGSEQEALQAAKEYIDQQTERGPAA